MIRIIAVGRLKDRRLAGLCDDYLARIRPLAAVEVVELKDAGPAREGRAMVDRLGSARGHELVVALDERGDPATSRELADLLGAHGKIAFLLGGADGLGEAARARADRALRLGRMTLPHELARLVLVEQVYRGLSILRGLPYHRD